MRGMVSNSTSSQLRAVMSLIWLCTAVKMHLQRQKRKLKISCWNYWNHNYVLKGHHVFMDNFYNSVELSQKLLDLRTHSCGTLRKNRKGNPRVLTSLKLKKGYYYWYRKGQIYVSMWRDKRPVYTISTRDHPKLEQVPNRHGKLATKPAEVAAYNTFMGGVDRADQMTSYYSSPRKSIRWY